MKYTRKQTLAIVKFAKVLDYTFEEALSIKSIPIKTVKEGKRFAFKMK